MTTSAKKIKPCPPGFSDHIYKVEHGVQVPLRIWPSPSVSEPAPWLFWIHGGGFQAGKHFVPNAWVHHAFNSRSYHIVSVAYRFAPECSMDEIFQDVTDAFHWCRSHLPQILGAVDIDNYVVGGDSAGGTLSTMCGHLLEPRPRVVLDLFGVVDNLDPEFMKHDPNSHIQSMPYEKADRDEDELRALLASRDKSKAAVTGAWSWELAMPLEDLKTFWGIKEYDTEEDTLRMDAFIYIAKSGMRLDNLYRREECASDQEFDERLKSWSSLLRLEGQTTYPPTYIIHGIADTAVPVGQSYRFQKKLEEMGVDTGASYAPGAEHSFDSQISSPEDAGWDEYIEPCMRFIDKHLKGI